MSKIKLAVVGVGNCASALLQGIEYYQGKVSVDTAGLLHRTIGGYGLSDIRTVAAFDVDRRKVGRPLEEAIFAPPNCTTVFQPEMEGAVVQVLGPLEAAGLEFDRLWIAGLSASQWPPAGRPTPLISRRLQRHYGLPDAEPDDTATYAQRVIGRLLASAPSCICSYPSRTGDSIETATALLADTPAANTPGMVVIAFVSIRNPPLEH